MAVVVVGNEKAVNVHPLVEQRVHGVDVVGADGVSPAVESLIHLVVLVVVVVEPSIGVGGPRGKRERVRLLGGERHAAQFAVVGRRRSVRRVPLGAVRARREFASALLDAEAGGARAVEDVAGVEKHKLRGVAGVGKGVQADFACRHAVVEVQAKRRLPQAGVALDAAARLEGKRRRRARWATAGACWHSDAAAYTATFGVAAHRSGGSEMQNRARRS